MNKEELELEKLKLEVSELKKPVFKRPTFWISFFGLILAIAGFFVQSTISKYESAKAEYESMKAEDKKVEAEKKAREAQEIKAKAEEETKEALLERAKAEEETKVALLKKAKAEEETKKALLKKDDAEQELAVLQNKSDALVSDIRVMTEKLAKYTKDLPDGADSSALEGVINSVKQVKFKAEAVEASTKEKQQVHKEKRYYVIALTSAKKEDIDNEINRVKRNLGIAEFEEKFPNYEIYTPEGYLSTLLISSKSLPYAQANELKRIAIEAGFSKDTWLWQSNVHYFSFRKD